MQYFSLQHFYRFVLFLLLTFGCAYLHAAEATSVKGAVAIKELVSIQDAWVRPTNVGQEVGAAYMTFLSAQNVTLMRIESDVTKSVEIHSMTMQNGVMKMRMLDTLALTAGKPYKLAPGGFHLMLFDLKKPLVVGEQVNFVLHFMNKNKVEFKQNIKAMVQPSLGNTSSSTTLDTSSHQHQQ